MLNKFRGCFLFTLLLLLLLSLLLLCFVWPCHHNNFHFKVSFVLCFIWMLGFSRYLNKNLKIFLRVVYCWRHRHRMRGSKFCYDSLLYLIKKILKTCTIQNCVTPFIDYHHWIHTFKIHTNLRFCKTTNITLFVFRFCLIMLNGVNQTTYIPAFASI